MKEASYGDETWNIVFAINWGIQCLMITYITVAQKGRSGNVYDILICTTKKILIT